MTHPTFTTVDHVMDELGKLAALHDDQDQVHAQAATDAATARPAGPVPAWDGEPLAG